MATLSQIRDGLKTTVSNISGLRCYDTAQDKLDAYITGSGSSSVRQVIYNNKSLGLADTDARVVNVSNYAADVNLNGIDGVGANLEIQVYTKGSS